MESAFLKSGTLLGSYRLDQKIALGGMAEIWSAWEEAGGRPGRRVAVKVLQPFFAQDPALAAMFIDELRIAERLNHPGVVRTYGGAVQGDWTYQVMEFLDGVDLRRIQGDLAKAGAWMRIPLVLRIGRDVALALEHAHQLTNDAGLPLEIVHRDVSPHNIMLTRTGQVKIIDFGIARAQERMTQTRTGVIKGKLAYMAPEQASAQPVTPRTDIFALGVVLFELLTMRKLFNGRSDVESLSLLATCSIPKVSEYCQILPETAAILVEEMLAKDPDDRPSSMASVARRLDVVLERVYGDYDYSEAALAEFLGALIDPKPPVRRMTKQVALADPEGAAPRGSGRPPEAPAAPTPKRRGPTPIDVLREPSLPGGRGDQGPLDLGLTFPGSLGDPEFEGVMAKVHLREDSGDVSTPLAHPAVVEATEAGGRSNPFDEPTEALASSQPELQQLLVLVDDTVLSNPNPTPPVPRSRVTSQEAPTKPAPAPTPRKPRPR